MVWIIVLMVLLLALTYLLLAPIVLHIDTATDQYYVNLKGLAKATLIKEEKEFLKVKLTVLFMNFNFYPLRKIGSSTSSEKKQKKKLRARGRKKKRSMSVRTAFRLLKSFKVKKFLIDIDTGDYVMNAKLYPIFTYLDHRFGGFYINFKGHNRLLIHMYNRPITLIKSFIN